MKRMDIQYQIKNDEFIIKDYNNSKPFASFFPAIAGVWGKPIWVFYVNRAQAISCLGTKDKDGAILEFVAANKAYRLTSLQGFRTFIKINNKFYEPFQNRGEFPRTDVEQRMHITSHLLKLVEINKKLGIEFTVEYFTVPNEKLPALIRILSIKNFSSNIKRLECIDGLPMIIPYGTGDYLLKNMSRLAEGWFSGVSFIGKYRIPVYKLKIEPEDRPAVVEIESANFYFGFCYDSSNRAVFPEFIVDPDIVFGELKDFSLPAKFVENSQFKNDPKATAKNKTPCGMGYFKLSLKKNETFKYYSIIGNVHKLEQLLPFVNRVLKNNYISQKQEENRNLIRNIGNKILTKTSSEEFDNYCQQTFLDNLLRGGYPIVLGKNENKKVYYVYSRIHGDMEREYNNFVIMPEYFSQGNGSYRDVNQNRRNDVFFNPEVKDEPFIFFMNLIQTDGFNPLTIMGSRFKIINKEDFLKLFKKEDRPKVESFISSPFTLGSFFNFLEDNKIKSAIRKEQLLENLIRFSEKIDYALPGIGYWSDHWHYNLDMLESFLGIYPEELETLLLKKKVFTFYDNPMVVLPRSEKYVLFNNKPRQLNAVYTHPEKQKMIEKRKENPNVVRTQYGKGSIYRTTLISKFICVIVNKFASLDPEGVGIEMESDKPNWCDALNGLPGVFGSSINETLELKRWILFILNSIESLKLKDEMEIKIAEEIADFFLKLADITAKHFNDKFLFWDKSHTLKEKYREKTLFGLSGKEKSVTIKQIKNILKLFLQKLDKGISKAIDKKKGIIYTNFENEVVKYEILKEKGKVKRNSHNLICIKPLKFRQKQLPLFLEGAVHFLRINNNKEKAKNFHYNLMKTGVYDKKLKMFKVNAPLKDASVNLGRIKVFTPGWLENESVWLHMEYKYLFELLRNGLTEEFYKIAKNALVPFMDPYIYGRSIFENVSFIVSSAHPEKKLYGQGFVARLSGSTAEFISMWIAITSGLQPFFIKDGKLYLKFKPQIASELFTKKPGSVKVYINETGIETINLPENSFLFKFLGEIVVIYHNPKRKNTFGKNAAQIVKIELIDSNGKTYEIEDSIIPPPYSYDIRERKIKRIEILLS